MLRLHVPVCLLITIMLAAPILQPARSALSAPICGTWQVSSSPSQDKRLTVDSIGEASGDKCQGGFVFTNNTGVLGVGGYSFELQVIDSENVENTWGLVLSSDDKVFALPSLDLELHNFVRQPSNKARVAIKGNMTPRSFGVDTSLTLLTAALDLVPIGCLVPKKQLAIVALRNMDLVGAATGLAMTGDLAPARQELRQVLPGFYRQAADGLKDVGLGCAVDTLAEIAGSPAIVAKLAIEYVARSSLLIWDYFKYEGRPLSITITYYPIVTPTSPPTSTAIPISTSTPTATAKPSPTSTSSPTATPTSRVPVGPVHTLITGSSLGGYCYDVSLSPNGQTLACGNSNNTVELWDVTSGKRTRTLDGHYDRVTSVSFSPNGQTLASGGSFTIRLRDASGNELSRLSQQSNDRIVFSPDGRTIASINQYKGVNLWDIASGKVLRTFGDFGPPYNAANYLWSVAFSPDGRTIASGGSDTTVRLWDVASGKELRSLKAHTDKSSVLSVAFSPNGRTLASATFDTTIQLWDVASGKELRSLNGHTGPVYSVAFSPNGQTIASGGWDGEVKLWDAGSGEELRTIRAHAGGNSAIVNTVAISPDGQTLASASNDGTVKLWGIR